MSFAENPHKVKNIVSKNKANFHNLYSPILREKFSNIINFDGAKRVFKVTEHATVNNVRFEISVSEISRNEILNSIIARFEPSSYH